MCHWRKGHGESSWSPSRLWSPGSLPKAWQGLIIRDEVTGILGWPWKLVHFFPTVRRCITSAQTRHAHEAQLTLGAIPSGVCFLVPVRRVLTSDVCFLQLSGSFSFRCRVLMDTSSNTRPYRNGLPTADPPGKLGKLGVNRFPKCLYFTVWFVIWRRGRSRSVLQYSFIYIGYESNLWGRSIQITFTDTSALPFTPLKFDINNLSIFCSLVSERCFWAFATFLLEWRGGQISKLGAERISDLYWIGTSKDLSKRPEVCPITQKPLRLDECQQDLEMKKRTEHGSIAFGGDVCMRRFLQLNYASPEL